MKFLEIFLLLIVASQSAFSNGEKSIIKIGNAPSEVVVKGKIWNYADYYYFDAPPGLGLSIDVSFTDYGLLKIFFPGYVQTGDTIEGQRVLLDMPDTHLDFVTPANGRYVLFVQHYLNEARSNVTSYTVKIAVLDPKAMNANLDASMMKITNELVDAVRLWRSHGDPHCRGYTSYVGAQLGLKSRVDQQYLNARSIVDKQQVLQLATGVVNSTVQALQSCR